MVQHQRIDSFYRTTVDFDPRSGFQVLTKHLANSAEERIGEGCRIAIADAIRFRKSDLSSIRPLEFGLLIKLALDDPLHEPVLRRDFFEIKTTKK